MLLTDHDGDLHFLIHATSISGVVAHESRHDEGQHRIVIDFVGGHRALLTKEMDKDEVQAIIDEIRQALRDGEEHIDLRIPWMRRNSNRRDAEHERQKASEKLQGQEVHSFSDSAFSNMVNP